MDTGEIVKLIEIIRKDISEGCTIKNAKLKYHTFHETYPTLFISACDPMFNMSYLIWMIEQSKKLNGNSSKQEIELADKLVYDKLREDFIPNASTRDAQPSPSR